jgi:hypothetical protein
MDVVFELLLIAVGYLVAGTIVYYLVRYLLRVCNIGHRRTMWSLLAGAVVPLALVSLFVGLQFTDPEYHPDAAPVEQAETPAPDTAAPAPDTDPTLFPAEPAPTEPAPAWPRPILRPAPGGAPQAPTSTPPETVVVAASRLFAGPGQYPPGEFAAYGILAFRSRATSQDRDRHVIICEAYIAGLPHVSELSVEPMKQMVTVWPTDSDENADKLNRMARTDVCHSAIDNYGLAASLQAIKEAVATEKAELSGIGPFLLAWSPSSEKGNKDALVLVMNLSGVTTYGQAQQILAEWSRDIERNPELWRDGWDIEKLRLEIRLWVDRYGPQILMLFGV